MSRGDIGAIALAVTMIVLFGYVFWKAREL